MTSAIESIKKHLTYVHGQQEITKTSGNRKNFRKIYKEHLRKQRDAWEDERDKREAQRRQLKSTCNPGKVRTYACQLDNTQKIEYFDYDYDMDKGQCVENVKNKVVTCQVNQPKTKKKV